MAACTCVTLVRCSAVTVLHRKHQLRKLWLWLRIQHPQDYNAGYEAPVYDRLQQTQKHVKVRTYSHRTTVEFQLQELLNAVLNSYKSCTKQANQREMGGAFHEMLSLRLRTLTSLVTLSVRASTSFCSFLTSSCFPVMIVLLPESSRFCNSCWPAGSYVLHAFLESTTSCLDWRCATHLQQNGDSQHVHGGS